MRIPVKKRRLIAAVCLLAATVMLILPPMSLAARAADAADTAGSSGTSGYGAYPGETDEQTLSSLPAVSAGYAEPSDERSLLACVNDGIAETDEFFPESESVLIPVTNTDWTCEGPLRRKPQMYSIPMESPAVEGLSASLPLFTAVMDTSAPQNGEETREILFTLDLTCGGGFMIDDPLRQYKTMVFGICFEGDEGDFPVSVRVDGPWDSGTAEVLVRAHPITPSGSAVVNSSDIIYSRSGWSRITVDLSALSCLPERLTVHVRLPADSFPSRVDLTAPLYKTSVPKEFAFAGIYSVCSFRDEEGSFSISSGEARCSERNRLTVSGDLAPVPQSAAGALCCFEMRLSGAALAEAREGSFSVDLEFLDGTRAEKAAAVSLNGEGTYSFSTVLPAKLRSYTLNFSFQSADEEPVVFRMETLKLYVGTPASFREEWYAGSVSRIEMTDELFRIKGSVGQYALRRYPGGKLRFYAVPAASVRSPDNGGAAFSAVYAADGSYAGVRLSESAVLFGESRISSRFEYSENLSGLGFDPSVCLFFVCIQPDGDDSLPIPLAPPHYPESKTGTAERYSSLSSYSLADALPVGVFEANASRVMENVDLAKLMTSEPGARSASLISVSVQVPGEESVRTVSLDPSVLADTDRNVRFYLSAGIAVYLRLQIPEKIPGLTSADADDSAAGYVPDMDSPAAVSLWAELIRFLSERYPGIAGFVLPGPVNDPKTAAGADLSSPWRWAERLAQLSSLTYAVACRTNPVFRDKYGAGANTDSDPYDIAVCVPFSEHPASASPEGHTMALMFAQYMKEAGTLPWTYLSCAGSDAGAPTQISVTKQSLERQSLPLPRAVMVLYQPTEAALTSAYKDMLRIPPAERTFSASYTEFIALSYTAFASACGGGARAVFFSLKDTPLRLNHDFYDTLKDYELRAEGSDSVRGSTAFPVEGRNLGGVSAAIWDFSDVYSSLGWIPGGGALSCATERNALYRSRVLSFDFQKTETESGDSEGTAGLAIRNLGFHADLSAVGSVLFDFTIEAPSENNQTVSLFFVIGGNKNRSEFYAEGVRCGERQQLVCDISGWDGRNAVDYIAVAVYAESEVSLKLKSVSAAGSLSSPEEVYALFFPRKDSGEERLNVNYFSLFAAMTAVAAAAATIFVLLTRQDRAYRSKPDDPDDGRRRERRML
jgi:hypothetical protein